MRTIEETIAGLTNPSPAARLSAPLYSPTDGSVERSCVALAVESMKRHMTNEGWELMLGLESAGYVLYGHDIGQSLTDVEQIQRIEYPRTVVVQDKREWMGMTADRSRDPRMRFTSIGALRARSDIFKVTVLKDAHNDAALHQEAANEIGCNAWICYYHPKIVSHLAPYVRPEHLIRTYHSVDSRLVPPYSLDGRRGCLLSGAVSGAYPLREKLVKNRQQFPDCTYLPHPGYHRRGCATPEFLKTLSRFKVAICTASRYGYALRKIMEATACGCRVLTDLPSDEVLPEIDGNLVRVSPDISVAGVVSLLNELYSSYDPEWQCHFANRAMRWYDYLAVGKRLADDVEKLRTTYNDAHV